MITNLCNSDTVSRDFTDAMAAIHSDRVACVPGSFNNRALVRIPLDNSRVNLIVSAGGFGAPFPDSMVTCDGMADASVIGGKFAAPSAYDIYEAAKYINSDKGYLLIYNNFMGDCLNNDLAKELMEIDGMKSSLIPYNDDCLSVEPTAPREERTGLLGQHFGIRIAALMAREGADLETLTSVIHTVRSRTSSMNVSFDEDNRLVELGRGISGEPARVIYSDEFSLEYAAAKAYDFLLKDLSPKEDETIYMLVNRPFNTNYEDTYIFSHALLKHSQTRVPIRRLSPGNYSRHYNYYGFGVSMLCCPNDLTKYLQEQCCTTAYIF